MNWKDRGNNFLCIQQTKCGERRTGLIHGIIGDKCCRRDREAYQGGRGKTAQTQPVCLLSFSQDRKIKSGVLRVHVFSFAKRCGIALWRN